MSPIVILSLFVTLLGLVASALLQSRKALDLAKRNADRLDAIENSLREHGIEN